MASRTLCWLLLFCLITSLALRTHGIIRPADTDTIYREQATYQHLREVIKERYVRDVDEKKLFYGALDGMCSSLDPHSRFFSPEEYEPFKTSTTGELEGVGIEIDYNEARGLTVVTPLQDTPAWLGGVLPGDKIVKINGTATEKMNSDEARLMIKGPPDTSVTLTLQHEGDDKTVEVTLKRAVISIKSVQVAEILGSDWVKAGDPKIGYVQVAQFQEKTAEDLDDALDKLEKDGMQALIIDLRQNPGGLLRTAEKVADLFLKDGLIVSVMGRSAEGVRPVEERYAEEKGTHPDYPIVILIDSHSASASEIVSGCLKDRGRAVLVGDKSYGKFSVQEIIPVPLGIRGEGALKLTTARYKTPTGECIDGKGIVPDYLVPGSIEFQRGLVLDRLQRHLKDNNPVAGRPVKDVHDLYSKDEDGNETKKPEPFVDTQLKKAVEVAIQKVLNAGQPAPAPELQPAAKLESKE
jgi:carboxyl-terminal processing protease